MIRFVVTALAVFFLFALTPIASAERLKPLLQTQADDNSIQRLRVQVMPEFDDPRVLVIVQGRLAATTFPRPITFRLPAGAQINQLALMDVTNGGTIPQAYDLAADPVDPRWSLVTYTLENAHFFYEYYYDPLAAGADKAFTFTYSSVQPVAELVVEVQQPRTAEGFSLEPVATTSYTDATYGLTYHSLAAVPLAAGEQAAVTIGYHKADPAPSLSREETMALQGGLPAEATTIPTNTTSQQTAAPISTSWLLALAVFVLISLGGFAWYRTRPVAAGGPANFCTQCGAALRPAAKFCHSCGAASFD